VSACGKTADFSVACLKLRPNSLCLDAEVLCFPLFEAVRHLGAAFSSRIGLPMRTTTVSDGRIRMPCRPQGFHFAILLLWRITIWYGDNCHNMRRLLL